MNKKIKKNLLLLIKIIVSISLLYFLVKKLNITKDVFDTSHFEWKWTILLVISAITQVYLQALRWRTLYGADEVPSIKEFVTFIFIGYFFSILLPWSLGGDAIKAVAFGKRHNGILHSSSAILFGRILGITALFIIFFVSWGLFRFPLDDAISYPIIIGTIVLIIGLTTFFITPNFIIQKLKEGNKVRVLLETITGLEKKQWIQGALYSIAIQIAMFSLVFGAFKLVGARITIPIALFYLPLTTLLLFLPISFSGLGVREASLTYFLTPFDGITSSHCIQASMVNYVALITLAIIGLFLFLFNKNKITQ